MQTKTCDWCSGTAKFGHDVPSEERGGTILKFDGKLTDPTTKNTASTVVCASCLRARMGRQ